MTIKRFTGALLAAGFQRTGRKASTNTNNDWGFGGAITNVEEWALDDFAYWVGTRKLCYRRLSPDSFLAVYSGPRGLDFTDDNIERLTEAQIAATAKSAAPRA